MQGKWLYFAGAGLLAVCTALESSIFALLALFLFLIFAINKRASRSEMLLMLIVMLLFFIRSYTLQANNESILSGKEKLFKVTFLDSGKIDGDILSTVVKDNRYQEKLALRYKITSKEKKQKLLRTNLSGLTCVMEGSLEAPPPASNENAFDYKRYLKQHAIHWILEPDRLELSQCNSLKRPIIAKLKLLREEGIRHIERHFPKDSVPLAAALLFGERELIDSDTYETYQKLGIVHLLAISGMQVVFIASLFFYGLIRLGITREKAVTVLLLILPLYCILTGGAPSVIRATLMLMLVLITKKYCKLPTIDIFSIAFICYIFYNPFIIYDIGFQLSFTITLFLLLSAATIFKKYDNMFSVIFATTLTSQLASIPIVLDHFYEISLAGFITNLVFIPVFTFLLSPAFYIGFLLSLVFGSGITPFLLPLNEFLKLLELISKCLVRLPFTTIVPGKPPLFLVPFYIIGLFVFFQQWEKIKNTRKFLLLFLIPVSLLFLQHFIMHVNPKGSVTFIDVGQGDSILIELPFRKGIYLIDTGGVLPFATEDWQMKKDPFEVGEDVVLPYLKSKGITKLDKLILTHGDFDHIGGAFSLMKELNIREVVLPAAINKSDVEMEILQLAEEKNIPVHFAFEGQGWEAAGYKFTFLAPQKNSPDSGNNQSLVLYTKMGGLKWLFTGDIEQEGERNLLNKYRHLSADVLKVAHHGSKTSTSPAFVQQLSPNIAVISAGKNNRFDHPHQEVLDTLASHRVKILQTNQHGAIQYVFQGEKGTFLLQSP
ncbi:DNA internalization-related competence protein ComEC/Rec2 [Bacillaceae bacterium Marseille-Q3522]|nr:DNA internalization-related competence protein ComEC/Rec2 [Bacillaceae bacterium Marseille-Q3522]